MARPALAVATVALLGCTGHGDPVRSPPPPPSAVVQLDVGANEPLADQGCFLEDTGFRYEPLGLRPSARTECDPLEVPDYDHVTLRPPAALGKAPDGTVYLAEGLSSPTARLFVGPSEGPLVERPVHTTVNGYSVDTYYTLLKLDRTGGVVVRAEVASADNVYSPVHVKHIRPKQTKMVVVGPDEFFPPHAAIERLGDELAVQDECDAAGLELEVAEKTLGIRYVATSGERSFVLGYVPGTAAEVGGVVFYGEGDQLIERRYRGLVQQRDGKVKHVMFDLDGETAAVQIRGTCEHPVADRNPGPVEPCTAVLDHRKVKTPLGKVTKDLSVLGDKSFLCGGLGSAD